MMMSIHTEKLSTEDPVFNSPESECQREHNTGLKQARADLSPESQICTLSRVDVSDIGQVQSGEKGADRNKTQESQLQSRVKIQA